MYRLFVSSRKVEKNLNKHIENRKSITQKLDRIKTNPRRNCGAHPLQGKLKGKWACWFGSNLRLIYFIDDENKIIYIEDIGTHKKVY